MKIFKVDDKKKYIDLLLLADESEKMVNKYIDKGTMYVLDDEGVKGEILVLDVGNSILEIKNLAVISKYQNQGYGRMLIDFVCKKYKNIFKVLQVGTGDSPLTIPFYEKCGFKRAYTIKNFFIENYDHPIIENGVKLVDMVYLKKEL